MSKLFNDLHAKDTPQDVKKIRESCNYSQKITQKNDRHVIAGIIEQEGRVFIARRKKKDTLEGFWEFPGGKVEQDETHAECLIRELFEEFGIVVTVGAHVCTSSFVHQNTAMQLHAYKVPSFSGVIELREHSESKWVTPDELHLFHFPEPDLVIIKTICELQKNNTPG